MEIIVALDVMLDHRRMKLKDLSEQAGVSMQSPFLLKLGKVKGVRFETRAAI